MNTKIIEKVIAGGLLVLLTIGVNVAVTQKVVDTKITDYANSIPAPAKPIVVDMDKIVKDLTSQGLEPIDVIVYTQTLNALLVKEGYLVLDKQNLLSYHPRYALQTIPNDKLLESAKKAGIDFEGPAREKMEKALVEGRNLVNSLLTEQ